MNKFIVLTYVTLMGFVSRSLCDDLTPLSDEFENASSLASWTRLFEAEGWGADQMQAIDIGQSRAGYLTMVPKTSSWYRDWKGVLMYKRVSGDFVATMEVEPRNRALTGAPGSSYSLAGIMARAPRDNVTKPADWKAGQENYIFLSMGTGNNPGNYQFEVKSTVNSSSSLEIDAGAARAIIQVVRISEVFLVLRKLEGSDWEVHRRYRRSDLPDTLQVGVTVYTDWSTVESMDPFVHNQTSIDGDRPDLNAAIDYFRFRRPRIPSWLADSDFSDPIEVTDWQIVQLFGDRSNRDPSAPPEFGLRVTDTEHVRGVGLQVEVESVPGYFYRLDKSSNMASWSTVETAEATDGRLRFTVPDEVGWPAVFLRVAEE